MQIIENHSLKDHHTFHLDVKAKAWASYSSLHELKELLLSDAVKDNKFINIGSGSNLLFTDDYDGLVLHSNIRFIEQIASDEESVSIRVGSGVIWDDFCEYAVENNLYGSENLSNIPGEVGASAVQNIGAYGAEVADIIEYIEAVEVETGKEVSIEKSQCAYGYRTSRFKNDWKGKYIITAVVYKLSKTPSFDLEYGDLKKQFAKDEEITLPKVRQAIIDLRSKKLPDTDQYGNVGSFFMNPIIKKKQYENLISVYPSMPHYALEGGLVKVPAAWLIEQCGWKGRSKGGAAVHEKQCLVIINKGEAVASDIVSLADSIQRTVQDRFDIKISPEVEYL